MTDERTEIRPEHRAFAERVIRELPFAQLIGMRLSNLAIDSATIEVEMRDDLRQPSGVLHGGVTATLIDTAMAFAVRTRLGLDEATATIDLTVHYLRPHIDGKIYCVAKIVRAGKLIFTVSADVFGKDDKLIATGLSTYTRV